jgi:hypothetical protein
MISCLNIIKESNMAAVDQGLHVKVEHNISSTSLQSTHLDGWSTAGLADSKFTKIFSFSSVSIQTISVGIHKGISYELSIFYLLSISLVCRYLAYFS